MISFENRVAIVTGGGRGIGAAIAKGLAKYGATVVIADIEGGAGMAASIGNGAFAIETDVGDAD